MHFVSGLVRDWLPSRPFCLLNCLFCCFSADLPRGARVGTSSLRRKAQVLHAHPHLQVLPVRGNIDQRLAMLKSGELDAIILAAAGELKEMSDWQ